MCVATALFFVNGSSSIDNGYIVHLLSSPLKNTEEEFEATKGVIRIHKSKKERQHNGQNMLFTSVLIAICNTNTSYIYQIWSIIKIYLFFKDMLCWLVPNFKKIYVIGIFVLVILF